jgi:Protein kinase domain
MQNPFATERLNVPIFPPNPPPRVPDHELVRRIGRGSYGEVWLARSVVGTCRAVKVVYRSGFEDARPFEREFTGIQRFEPISRSDEGLVDILQLGRNDEEGYFYYVMELADDAQAKSEIRNPKSEVHRNPKSEGRSLESFDTPCDVQSAASYVPKTLGAVRSRNGRLSAGECVDLGEALTLALARLHEHGLIHRDIKPSNIIFVKGVPKLADIGLVVDVGEARSYVGTEGFIPPEGPNSPQADIYSLGKVLYEVAMGRDRHDFPEPCTGLADDPQRKLLTELNAVILKACEPDPHDRYRSARAMHADLLLLQAGKSVRQKWASERRLKWFAWAAAVIALLAVSALAADRVLAWRIHALQAQSSFIQPALVGKVEGRPASTPDNLLDLSRCYNAALIERWYPGPEGNTLKALPREVQTLAGVPFDVRGLIQLSGQELRQYSGDQFPTFLRGIPVHRWAKRLHFLHGAVSEVMDGRKIGAYRIRYASGRTQELAVVYGQEVRALWQPGDSSGVVSAGSVAWTGRNPAATPRNEVLRLYKQTWENPTPEEEITVIDFESAMANSAPFLIAVTVDEHKRAAPPQKQSVAVSDVLQAQPGSLQRLTPDTNSGAARLAQLRLNEHPVKAGAGFCDAFRFTTPAGGPTDLVWAFAGSPDVHSISWYITPLKGRMKVGFEDWYHGATDAPASTNGLAKCTLQFLSGKKLQPGREYMIWFAFDQPTPVTLRAALRFSQPGRVDPNKPETLLHALGRDGLLTCDPGKMHRHYCLGAMK